MKKMQYERRDLKILQLEISVKQNGATLRYCNMKVVQHEKRRYRNIFCLKGLQIDQQQLPIVQARCISEVYKEPNGYEKVSFNKLGKNKIFMYKQLLNKIQKLEVISQKRYNQENMLELKC